VANLCQDDYGRARPTEYFPATGRTGRCDACGEDPVFVARANADDVASAKDQIDAYEQLQKGRIDPAEAQRRGL
jgi:hypothetical protein